MVTLRFVKAVQVFFGLCAIVSGDRDRHADVKSISMTRDGHFHLQADADIAVQEPDSDIVVSKPEKRLIRALLPREDDEEEKEEKKNSTNLAMFSMQKGDWLRHPNELKHKSASSSFVNRTDDWMTLSQVSNGTVASSRLARDVLRLRDPPDRDAPQPKVPPQRYQQKPKSWKGKAWSTYQRAMESLKGSRAGTGNTMATVGALVLGPDCCLLKIAYVFFAMDGEDDYPYIPRGCGDMFDFAMNANGIPVPWLLIGGALAIVTGTHSTASSL